jgi:hypothetical protein
MDDRGNIEVSGREARQATREGVARYVLAVSLGLVVVAFAILWLVFFA